MTIVIPIIIESTTVLSDCCNRKEEGNLYILEGKPRGTITTFVNKTGPRGTKFVNKIGRRGGTILGGRDLL